MCIRDSANIKPADVIGLVSELPHEERQVRCLVERSRYRPAAAAPASLLCSIPPRQPCPIHLRTGPDSRSYPRRLQELLGQYFPLDYPTLAKTHKGCCSHNSRFRPPMYRHQGRALPCHPRWVHTPPQGQRPVLTSYNDSYLLGSDFHPNRYPQLSLLAAQTPAHIVGQRFAYAWEL